MVTNVLLLLVACYFMFPIHNSAKAIINTSFCHCHQERSFLTLWRHPEMCSERDSPLKRLYRRTHAKLTRLAGSGQLVWAPGCEFSLALVHARRQVRDRARHPRQYFGWPRIAKRGRPITHEWIDPWTLLLPGQHRWAQVGATDEPREFRLAGSRQDKRLERAIPLTTHLCVTTVDLWHHAN